MTREFLLQYKDANTDQSSFATLNENEDPYTFLWSKAKNKAGLIHFGFIAAPWGGLLSPEDTEANFYYGGNDGVGTWDALVLAGITFDGGAAPNVNFDDLTVESIAKNVPDSGFGGDDKTSIAISDGQIIRFVQKDINNVTRYKGYLKVIFTDLINSPRAGTVKVKYIKK